MTRDINNLKRYMTTLRNKPKPRGEKTKATITVWRAKEKDGTMYKTKITDNLDKDLAEHIISYLFGRFLLKVRDIFFV
jgi:hypothetical protein